MKQKHVIIFLVTFGLLVSFFSLDLLATSGDVGNAFSGGVSSDYSSGSSSSDSSFIIWLLFYWLPFPYNIMFFMFLGFIGANAKGSYDHSQVSKFEQATYTKQVDVVGQIKRLDPNFSKYAFLTYAKECLITLQESIEARELNQASAFVEQKYMDILKNNMSENTDYYYEGQEILNASYKNAYQDDEFLYVVVELFVSEYLIALNHGEKLEDKHYKTRTNNVYELTFKRKLSVLTDLDNMVKPTNCPSCGAPNQINNQGECEYCNNVITSGDYSFILMSMVNINERSSIYYKLFHSNKLGALNNEELVVSEIQKVDENFELVAFENFVEQAFIGVQEAWEARDLDEIKKYESADLNDIHQSQIREFIKKDLYPKIEDQEVLDINVNRFEIDGKYEYVTVVLACKLKVFVLDNTGEVVSGNDKLDTKRGYLLRFKRARGVKSTTSINPKFCPSCGAPIELGEFGTCEYCNSSIINGEHGWVMDSYEAINRV